jgi:hypothetical protein
LYLISFVYFAQRTHKGCLIYPLNCNLSNKVSPTGSHATASIAFILTAATLRPSDLRGIHFICPRNCNLSNKVSPTGNHATANTTLNLTFLILSLGGFLILLSSGFVCLHATVTCTPICFFLMCRSHDFLNYMEWRGFLLDNRPHCWYPVRHFSYNGAIWIYSTS